MHTGNASQSGQEVRPPRMLMTMMDEHARHKLGMPETWQPYRYEHVDPDIVLITGMVAPLRTSGRDKGYPNFRKGDRTTERKTGFSTQEHFQFQRAWELRTGKCANCIGSGKVIAAAHADGTRAYRQCDRCEGSGKAPPLLLVTTQA